MTIKAAALLLLLGVEAVAQHDTFNYNEVTVDSNNYGQPEWDLVQCHDVSDCPGWPTNWEDFDSFIPYEGTSNMCKACGLGTSTGGTCASHKQSPIELFQNVTGIRNCHDRHRMNYGSGNCRFDAYRFEILPHTLRAYQPHYCANQSWIDFSMGFPNDWHLEFTDISVPSQHSINGKRYDAEVVMSHSYSVDRIDRLIGNVAVLLEKGSEADHFDTLELYIQRWLQEEDAVIQDCFERNFTESNEPSARRQAEWAYGDLLSNQTTFTTGPEKIRRPEFKRHLDPYDWYPKSRTEYYFRYEGSMPEPPCFEGVHWRVMKNALKVSPRQLKILENLLADRIDPQTCKPHTAGKSRGEGRVVDVNRDLQTTTPEHKLVFCECADWPSTYQEDLDWCALSPEERGILPFAPGLYQ